MRKLFIALVGTWLVVVACTNDSGAPRAETNDLGSTRTVDDGFLKDEGVVVSLFYSQELVLIDPLDVEATAVARMPEGFSPAGTAHIDGLLAVVGSATGSLWLVDPQTGERVSETFLNLDEGSYVLKNGQVLYVVGDSTLSGAVIEVDATAMVATRTARVGPGQAGATLDGRGRLWTIGEDAIGSGETSVSLVDLRTMKSRVRPLPGSPKGIVPLSSGSVLVSLLHRDEVVKLNRTGRVIDRVEVGNDPWGMVLFPPNRVLVVADRNRGRTSHLYVLDPSPRLRVVKRVPLPGKCANPRDAVIAANSVVITCPELPGVAVLPLPFGTGDPELIRMVEGLPAEELAPVEEPRSPLVVPESFLLGS